MMRQVLGEFTDPVSRSKGLGARVEIALAAHDVAAARSSADELAAVAATLASPYLDAAAAQAAGAVAAGRRRRPVGPRLPPPVMAGVAGARCAVRRGARAVC